MGEVQETHITRESILRIINTAKSQHDSKNTYQFGVLIPRNHKHAMEIDLKAGRKSGTM